MLKKKKFEINQKIKTVGLCCVVVQFGILTHKKCELPSKCYFTTFYTSNFYTLIILTFISSWQFKFLKANDLKIEFNFISIYFHAQNGNIPKVISTNHIP